MTIHVMIGLDCDRPRGEYIRQPEGSRMAEAKMLRLEQITETLDRLNVPRTYFICGQFLSSMAEKFGRSRIRSVFSPQNPLCEIGDHTYSHNVFKHIPTRPDKVPLSPDEVIAEFRLNTAVFESVLDFDSTKRGVRAPLGHYRGVQTESRLVELLAKEGVAYISSDARDEQHSICPPLMDSDGHIRQPYLYANGLLEIPAHGWHDTVFAHSTQTPIYKSYPKTYEEIIQSYKDMVSEARGIAAQSNGNLFLGLVLHPSNVLIFDPQDKFFDDLVGQIRSMGAVFSQYQKAWQAFCPADFVPVSQCESR